MAVRAVRGAIQVETDEPEVIYAAVREMLAAVLDRNDLKSADLISMFFTTTSDLTSCFPAAAARQGELSDVPVLCASEIAVPGALPRTVRLLAHVETNRPRARVRHAFLGAAAALRDDLPQ